MAQRLWDGTETLFTLVRFNQSLTRADISRLAEQHLESQSDTHDWIVTTIGHYPKPEDLRASDDAASEAELGDEDDSEEGSDVVFNDPATWIFLYESRLDGLKRDRAVNNFASVRGKAQELALSNEIDIESSSGERALCRALLDVEIAIAEEKLAYLQDAVLPYHPLHGNRVRTVQALVEPTKTAPASTLKHGQDLFSKCWETYGHDRVLHGEWKPSIERQSQSTGRLFVEICGDKRLGEYGPADAAKFKRALLSLPANYDKNTEWRKIRQRVGIRGLIEHCSGRSDVDLLKPQTFNRHLAALSGLWPWAQSNEVVAKGLPSIFEGLHINLRRARGRHHRARDERPMWNHAELVAVFNAPLFIGLRSRRGWKTPGPYVLRDERYWGILIGSHSGMRRGEIFQLRVKHVVQDTETGIWYFNLMEQSLQLKAEGSARWIPLHQNLLKLGLIEALVAGRGENELLLPEGEVGAEAKDVLDDGDDTAYGSAFGKWFQRFKSEYGARKDVVFHSFRHSAATLLVNAGAQTEFVEELIGHESMARRSELRRYNKGQTLVLLKDVVDRLVLLIDVDKLVDAARIGEPCLVSILRR